MGTSSQVVHYFTGSTLEIRMATFGLKEKLNGTYMALQSAYTSRKVDQMKEWMAIFNEKIMYYPQLAIPSEWLELRQLHKLKLSTVSQIFILLWEVPLNSPRLCLRQSSVLVLIIILYTKQSLVLCCKTVYCCYYLYLHISFYFIIGETTLIMTIKLWNVSLRDYDCIKEVIHFS